MNLPSISAIFAVAATIFLFLYYRYKRNFNYWKKLSINGPKPIFFFGNFKDVLLQKLHIAELVKSVYDEFKSEPVIGLYSESSPVLIVRDRDLLKDVLVGNFNIFADRGIKKNIEKDPISENLTSLNYQKWKALRSKLSPTFTLGKLKEKFLSIVDCSTNFEKYVEKIALKGEPVECHDLCAKFTIDVIGISVFGLNMNAISDDDSEFRKFGKKMLAPSWYNFFRRLIKDMPLWLSNLLWTMVRDDYMVNFFTNTLKETMDYRINNNIKKNDFIEALMDIKENPGKVGLKGINFCIFCIFIILSRQNQFNFLKFFA